MLPVIKSFNETELSVVFSELNLKHFNIESYVLLPIKTNDIKISGSINLFIENNEFKNIHFNIASKLGDIKFTEKYINSYLIQENLYYENFLLSGNYDFQTKIIKYENLKFDIHNDQGSIIYALIDGYADKKLTNFLNIKIDFLNYHLGSLSLFNNKDLNNLLVNEYSGSASFKLVDDKIVDINIFIKDLSLRNLNIIDLSFKSQNLQSEKYLDFSLNGNVNELLKVIESLNLIDFKENLKQVSSFLIFIGLIFTGFVFLTGTLTGGWFNTTLQFTLLAIGFASIILGTINDDKSYLSRLFSARIWVPIARLSYSLYLVHLRHLKSL